MSKMKGQLSIEYILLLAVSLAILCILFASYSYLYKAGVYANDVLNAKNFSISFSSFCQTSSLAGDGTKTELLANVLENWVIRNKDKKVLIIVKSKTNKEKEFFFDCAPGFVSSFDFNLSESKHLILEKKKGKIEIRLKN